MAGSQEGPFSSYSNQSVSTLLFLCDPNAMADAAGKLTPATSTYVTGTQTLLLDYGNPESGGWSLRPPVPLSHSVTWGPASTSAPQALVFSFVQRGDDNAAHSDCAPQGLAWARKNFRPLL